MSTTLTVSDDPKMLREALCVAEHAVNQHVAPQNQHGAPRILAALIAECDRHRPLGPDGKHGDRHTDTCGCEPTPAPLDPSKVKAGDTATVRVEYTGEDPAEPFTVTAVVTEQRGGLRWVGPVTFDREGGYTTTLIDHQPAPEPEPALPFKTGVVVEDVDNQMRYFRANGLELPWVSETGTWQSDEYVSRLNWRAVPDEPRPLPTRQEMASAIAGMPGLLHDSLEHHYDINPFPAADRVHALLRGESR